MALLDVLKKKAALNDGVLPLDEFLNTVLYHKDYGYYATRQVFGKPGDYITSPHISQLFGELIAFWILDQWIHHNRPEKTNLVELGPGTGVMMADMVRVFKKVPDFYQGLSIHLVEKSPNLQKTQQESLMGEPITWHDDVFSIQVSHPTFWISNEFFDALPIKQFCDKGEQKIKIMGDELTFTLDPNLPLQEFCPLQDAILKTISTSLKTTMGSFLMIDYGDYVKNRHQDTLQALYNHKRVGVFDNLGHADISHHVDFYAIDSFFKKEGFFAVKVTDQEHFLKELGLEQRLLAFKNAPSMLIQAARLTDPRHMGAIFKVLGLSTTQEKELWGFSHALLS